MLLAIPWRMMSELIKCNNLNFIAISKTTTAYNFVCSYCTLRLQLQGHAQELHEEHVDFQKTSVRYSGYLHYGLQ